MSAKWTFYQNAGIVVFFCSAALFPDVRRLVLWTFLCFERKMATQLSGSR